jgi:hypothetical protein
MLQNSSEGTRCYKIVAREGRGELYILLDNDDVVGVLVLGVTAQKQ